LFNLNPAFLLEVCWGRPPEDSKHLTVPSNLW